MAAIAHTATALLIAGVWTAASIAVLAHLSKGRN